MGLQQDRKIAGSACTRKRAQCFLQVLESPEDMRTAATVGAGRQGRAGRRCLLRAAAPQAFTETLETWPPVLPLPFGLAVLLKSVVLVLLGARAGEKPRDGHSRKKQPRIAAYNGLSGAICNNSCNSLDRWS